MKFKQLNQFHPSYDAERIRKYDLLYEGGEDIIKNASMFIHMQPEESAAAYNNRLKCASYKNYMAQIVNSYVAELFNRQMVVVAMQEEKDGKQVPMETDAFYTSFFQDCDLMDTSLQLFMREMTAEAMVHGCAYVGVDFPKVDVSSIQSLKDEETSGADRAYVFEIDNASVINWEMDDFGSYKWVVLKTESWPQPTHDSPRDTRVTKFKVWQKKDGVVSYEVWQVETKKGKATEPNAELTLVDSGTVSFKEVPVLKLHFDEELSVGCLIGAQCADLFRRKSALNYAQYRSLFALLVFKQGPELPADGSLSEMSSNPFRGQQAVREARSRGGVAIGSEDEISFVEPAGASFEIAHECIKDDVDELNRVTHTMAQSLISNTTSVGRSGVSKMADNRAKEIVLSAFADVVKGFIRELYNFISAGRNEMFDWHVLGMDNYKIVDREQLMMEAETMASVEIPSQTLLKHRLFRLASNLEEDLSPEVLLQIKQEIDEKVSSGWVPTTEAMKMMEEKKLSETSGKKDKNAPQRAGRRTIK